MKSFLLLAGLLSVSAGFAQNRSIAFEKSSWTDIQAKAKREGKLIFLDAYASWCGPCKWMAANTFTNDSVADFFNRHFVNAKIDMELGEGKLLQQRYMVMAFPTLLFINGDGELVHRRAGALQPDGFIALGQTALDTSKQLKTYIDRFRAGDRSDAFIVSYIDVLQRCGLQAWGDSVFVGYLSSKREEQLTEPQVWKAMFQYLSDKNLPAFRYVLANERAFKERYTSDTLHMFVSAVYLQTLRNILYSRFFDQQKYDDLLDDIQTSGYSRSDEIRLKAELTYSLMKRDYKRFENISLEYASKFSAIEPELLNQMAWTFYEQVDTPSSLEKALTWALKVIQETGADYAYDTAAMLYFKLGNKEKALYYEEEALKLARMGSDLKTIRELEENLRTIQQSK